MRQEQLLNYLGKSCRGRANRVSGRKLEQMLGIGKSQLQKQVNQLRQQGYPIGSDEHGYYYAVNAGEVCATAVRLRKMARGLELAAMGMERSLDHFTWRDGASHG